MSGSINMVQNERGDQDNLSCFRKTEPPRPPTAHRFLQGRPQRIVGPFAQTNGEELRSCMLLLCADCIFLGLGRFSCAMSQVCFTFSKPKPSQNRYPFPRNKTTARRNKNPRRRKPPLAPTIKKAQIYIISRPDKRVSTCCTPM